ncbi:MAG TPA: ribonuclease P protein component [Treponemataceae bacterium]|nr:ribonuclease P protein component [Treponemataceae bacterium]
MKRAGFSKAERLVRSAAIQTVFKKGRKFGCEGAKLFVLGNGTDRNRVAFTFPRGYGTAVSRNRSRRLSRETYRLMKTRLITGNDLVFLVFPGYDDFRVRERQLSALCARAGLWSSPS